MCVQAKIDPSHECRTVFGKPHRADDLAMLTLEHVKDDLMMGKRAPDDLDHLVALCGLLNNQPPAKEQRENFRAYLDRVNP
jgi:hypothetical protein